MLPMNAKKTNKNSPQTSQKMTDSEKRNFIGKVQDFISSDTLSELNGKNLEKVYQKALRDAEKKKGGGKVMYREAGGPLKNVPADNPGLAKLPTKVRNNMGFAKGGGKVMKYKKGGIIYKQGGGIIKANSGGQGIVDSGYTKV
jgi:hypothetical protein